MDKQIGRQSKLLLNGQTDRHAEGYVRRQEGTQGQSELYSNKTRKKRS